MIDKVNAVCVDACEVMSGSMMDEYEAMRVQASTFAQVSSIFFFLSINQSVKSVRAEPHMESNPYRSWIKDNHAMVTTKKQDAAELKRRAFVYIVGMTKAGVLHAKNVYRRKRLSRSSLRICTNEQGNVTMEASARNGANSGSGRSDMKDERVKLEHWMADEK